MASLQPPALEQCPYDKNHRVSVQKFWKHLEKCRLNYKLNALKTGGHIDVFTCKYNHDHQVFAPELLYHEERCDDRNFLHPHQLQPAVNALREAGKWPYELDLGKFEAEEKKVKEKKTFGGIHLEAVSGRDSFDDHVPLENIKFPAAAAKKNAKALAEKMETEKRQEEEKRKKEEALPIEELEEIKYWNKYEPGNGFSYMESWEENKPQQPWIKYPPAHAKMRAKANDDADVESSALDEPCSEKEKGSEEPTPGSSAGHVVAISYCPGDESDDSDWDE